MTVGSLQTIATDWTAKAKGQRWKRPYTNLVYQPTIEVLRCFCEKEFKTNIVTGGGQDFVRTYAERVYGVPPQNVIGSTRGLHDEYDEEGQAVLMRPPKLLLNNLSGSLRTYTCFLGVIQRRRSAIPLATNKWTDSHRLAVVQR
jgi:hypothetical protein